MERKDATHTDPSTRLDCCNLSVPWSKWWSQSWSIQGGGNPTQHKVQWVKVPSGSGGSSQVPPQAGSFTLFDAALWLICCPLVEGPRIESGVFGGLWPLVRPGCSYSIWGRVFSEGMNTSRPVCECPNTCPQAGKFYTTASGVREDIGMIKSIIPAPQDLLLIDLFPNLAQKKSPCWAKSLCFGYPLVMGEIPGLFLCKSKVSSPHIQKLCSSP